MEIVRYLSDYDGPAPGPFYGIQGELLGLADISSPDVVFWDGGPRAGIWRRRGLSAPACYPTTLDPDIHWDPERPPFDGTRSRPGRVPQPVPVQQKNWVALKSRDIFRRELILLNRSACLRHATRLRCPYNSNMNNLSRPKILNCHSHVNRHHAFCNLLRSATEHFISDRVFRTNMIRRLLDSRTVG